LTEDDVLFWGPGLSLRRGAIRVDPRLPSIEGHPPVRMTVDVADRSRRDLVTVIVARAIGAAAHTGALAIVPVPLFSTTGFVNSADYSAGAKAPDSWVDLYGARLAARLVIDGNLPTSIDGTRVTLTASDGIPRDARLHFVSPDRIQFLMPPDIADAAATLRVVTTEGAGSARIQAAPVAPGLFSANATGRGPAAATFLRVTAAGARTEDYTFTLDPPPNRVNAPVTLTAGDVYLSFYGTGFRRQARATCQIGGFDVPVLAAVSQGQFPGLDQAVVGPVPLALAGRANAEVAFIFDGVRANVVTVSFR
jgi:uncharacterized protein (TIGR03437 family)